MKKFILLSVCILLGCVTQSFASEEALGAKIAPQLKELLETKNFVLISEVTAQDIGFKESGSWDRSSWDRELYKYNSNDVSVFIQITVDPSGGEVFVDSIYRRCSEEDLGKIKTEVSTMQREIRKSFPKTSAS